MSISETQLLLSRIALSSTNSFVKCKLFNQYFYMPCILIFVVLEIPQSHALMHAPTTAQPTLSSTLRLVMESKPQTTRQLPLLPMAHRTMLESSTTSLRPG